MDKKRLDKLLEKEWVIQSCEASQWLFYPPLVGSLKPLTLAYGNAYTNIMTFVEDGYGYSLYSQADADRLSRRIVAQEEARPGHVAALVEEWSRGFAKFLDYCKKIDGMDLQSLADGGLAGEFDSYHDAFVRGWGLSLMADAFSLNSERLLCEQLQPVLELRGESKMFSRYLPVLTAPVTKSFAMGETASVLHLAQEAEKSPEIASALSKTVKDRARALHAFPEFASGLHKHARDYFWLGNSYLQTRVLDESYFADRVSEALTGHKDLGEEIRRLETAPQKASGEKKELCKKLALDETLVRLLGVVEKFAEWMDARKNFNLVGDHYMMLFQDELCRRKGYRKEDWLALSAPEYTDALAGKIDAKAMAQRTRASLFICTNDGLEILAGDAAKSVFSKIRKDTHDGISDVRGTTASPGRVEGTVRIIMSTTDLPKMRKGDVLVSGMTRPELTPALKKAVAIVTDEGGITSHAAIVSRELGIPCVIGTKIATKVFKDGDFVEVNANHGVVRKLVKK
ncbi:MAG: PEP-utilizing enzyme [Candidatus Micrarchaeota archaeon]